MDKSKRFHKDISIENRKARFDYEIIETFEMGLVLKGCEVKSIREGKVSLAGTFVVPKGKELLLQGMHITPYFEGKDEVDPVRDRQLLFHRGQRKKIVEGRGQSGYTIVPLKLYFNAHGYAKVLVGLCRGKKAHDKRETIKARDNEREMRRERVA